MAEILLKSVSVVLAVSFCAMILQLIRQCFPGWASDAAISRGAGLALLSLVVAVFLSSLVMLATSHKGATPNLWIEAYATAGLCEESARLLSLVILLRGMMTKDPREFIAGATAVGLGFGVMENLMYLSGNKGIEISHVQLGAIRGMISAPIHLACAYISGYGLWSIARQNKHVMLAIGAFAFAVFLHGTFDMALMSLPDKAIDGPGAMGLAAKIGIGCVIVCAIVTSTWCTLNVFSHFLGLCKRTASHQPSAYRQLSWWWRPVATVLILLAAALALLAPGVMFLGDALKSVHYTPLLIGGALSMALWSISIRSLAD